MAAQRKHIPRETLKELYLENSLSPKEIGARLGYGETTIRKRLQEYAIPMRSRSEAIRLSKGIEIEHETLVRLYHDLGLSIPKVAAHLGCSEDTVRSRMQEYHIPRRTPSESARLSRGIDLPKALAQEWYEQQELSAATIAMRLDCSETAVRNKLIEYGIKRRAPWAHNAVDLEEDRLRRLYKDESLTVEAIAKMYSCSTATVSRKMKKYGIKARPPWRERYPRHDFSGDLLEKAYLIGFRLGDLTVRRAELSIEVIMTTTRQDQIDLMHDLFDRYGHVYEHRRSDGRTFLQTRLNDTFDFLLPQEDCIPDWVLTDKDDQCFFAFMAGYVDADGSIRVVGNHSARLDIQTYDKGLQRDIWESLARLGIFCPPPRVVVKAGYVNPVGIVQRQDKWGMWIHRRWDLSRLLEHLFPYLQHAKRRQDAMDALHAIKIE
jgi:DNA-directed RNA polymerase specialized sigma24 family protein